SYYLASIVLSIKHQPEEAEAILKEGLEFDPYNAYILRSLAELHWELRDEFVGLDSAANQQKADFHWRGIEYFRRAEKLMKDRSDRYQNFSYLIDLADLYLA